jgi:phytanoyl-CoA hydroxylase
VIELKTPRGLIVNVPENQSEDPSERFDFHQKESIYNYYMDNGYVIVRKLFSNEDCLKVIELWNKEVKISDKYMYRQATAKAEKHIFNINGWIMNPILNLQSINPFQFPNFRKFATNTFLASNGINSVFHNILLDYPKIVQSMFFEGNSVTWEHQDTYYLDSDRIGTMAAAWIALEDIAPNSGRFFVCPKSHLINLDKQNEKNNIIDYHDKYISEIVDVIKNKQLEIRAPYLERGDVLFWNSKTIHGSLDSQDKNFTRLSITCHAIRNDHNLLQFQKRIIKCNTTKINNTYIYAPKDLSHLHNRFIFYLESYFPKIFYFLKNLVIKKIISNE